ncbi:histidine kinase [Marinospirillum minutulum]|uniref:histidine kinase n=1 Tax=Marinospirillum minutulum TaxID=64974 RepID=UPI0012EC6059|nr:histidine kinase [Marinospirillum minutulum]
MKRKSLVTRIAIHMVIISAMAITSILASYIISDRMKGDAAALNIAGSLRMQTFRIINSLQEIRLDKSYQTESLNLEKAIKGFADRLASEELVTAIPRANDNNLHIVYLAVVEKWQGDIKPKFVKVATYNARQLIELEALLDAQYHLIDSMVSALEKSTDKKVKLQIFIQTTFMLLAFVAIVVAFFDIREKVVIPLGKLMSQVKEVRRGNFVVRQHAQNEDELADLGEAINDMSRDLSSNYRHLEKLVSQKTLELERSHQALQLLHDAGRLLYENSDNICQTAVPMLKKLEQLIDIGSINLYINDQQKSIKVMTTLSASRPIYCRNLDCSACIDKSSLDNSIVTNGHEHLYLPVATAGRRLGTLDVAYPLGRQLSQRSVRLLQTLSDQLATAIYIQQQMQEGQQLSLLEERSIIARELHDSLAQSLSYLKIQISRLQKQQQKENTSPKQQETLVEVRTGVNNAYRQLRELLTTFRLELDKPGLRAALEKTVEEFSERLGFLIFLEFDLPSDLLSPNEEIHVLQVVREALSNVMKHAKASSVKVKVRRRGDEVEVAVEDDGRGFNEANSPDQHYGLIIMRDRAVTLGGKINLYNLRAGGVGLYLSFMPALLKQQAEKVSA